VAAVDPHNQYALRSELTVQDLVAFGLTFHFRSDAPICDTNHAAHASTLATVNALGVSNSYIVCDEFSASLYATNLSGKSMTVSAGTLAISGNVLQTLAGLGMTSAAGAITVAASDPDTLIVTPLGAGMTSAAQAIVVAGGGVIDLTGVALSGGAGTLPVSGSGAATLTLTGVPMTASAGTLTIPMDTTPDAFSFTDVTDATASTLYTSGAITVAGINGAATVTLSGTGANNAYEKNTSGTWTSAQGTANVGDTFKVRHTSSASASTATTSILTIGGVSDTYSVTTAAAGGNSFSDDFSGSLGDSGKFAIYNNTTPYISSGKLNFDHLNDAVFAQTTSTRASGNGFKITFDLQLADTTGGFVGVDLVLSDSATMTGNFYRITLDNEYDYVDETVGGHVTVFKEATPLGANLLGGTGDGYGFSTANRSFEIQFFSANPQAPFSAADANDIVVLMGGQEKLRIDNQSSYSSHTYLHLRNYVFDGAVSNNIVDTFVLGDL